MRIGSLVLPILFTISMAACSDSGGSSPSSGSGPVAAPAVEATTTATQPARPVLPRGQAPRFLIGQWSGGPGKKTGRYLIVTADGRYERGREQGAMESAGTVVANNDTAVFYDIQGGREQAALTYTDAAGIVVLSVDYAEQGYYSYVPV